MYLNVVWHSFEFFRFQGFELLIACESQSSQFKFIWTYCNHAFEEG
jgi:hypothetical protein